ncbi:MAG: hypothetical protein KAI24_24210 [Planctomycetes bacterium]|nr:hypothetical protein [Planctomycetota bacterium]
MFIAAIWLINTVTEESAAPAPIPPAPEIGEQQLRQEPSLPISVAEPAHRTIETAPAPQTRYRAAELEGVHARNVARVNRVLRKAGRQPLPDDALLTAGDLETLNDMVVASDNAINEAANRVLDFQAPHADEMVDTIKSAVDAGSTPPYRVLLGGRVPQRGRYELLITSAYKGVVYAHTIPVSQELMETVDAQHTAEALRLDAYTAFAERLR